MKATETQGSGAALMSGRTLRRGLAGFAALTVAGLGALYVYGLRSQAERVVTDLSAGFFALALLAALFDFFIGGLRHHVFLRHLVPGSRLRLPLRADLVGRFTGAVTPSQSGGGPGQIFMLYRGGIPLPAILSTLTVNLLATLIFFVLVGVPATIALGEQTSSGGLRELILFGFAAVLGLTVFLALALTRPDLVVRPIAALTRRLEGRHGALARATHRVGTALVECAERYKDSCALCLREGGVLPLVAVVLTVVMYLNKFTLGWLIVRGLGLEVSYVMALAAQAILHLILYAAPTPGASGIAEISTGALMSLLIPAGALATFTLAYRFFLTYLPAAIGALILSHELRPERKTVPLARAAVATGVIPLLMTAMALPRAAAAQVGVDLPPVRIVTTSVAPIHGHYHEMVSTIMATLEDGITATSRSDSLAAFDLAVDLASQLVGTAPDDAHAHYLLAVSFGQRLELSGVREKIRLAERCLEEAEQALALDPDHPGAHHVIGRLHAGTMRLGAFQRFVARQLLGAKAMEGASWDVAEHHFTRAAAIEPGNPRHWLELASLYIDTGRPELAMEALRHAAGVTPSSESERRVVGRARQLLASMSTSSSPQ